MYDPRLIGSWRSDSRKTCRDIAARRNVRASKKLLGLFGKMELRYTRTHCRLKLGAYTTVSPYKVVARDPSSVAIVSQNPVAGKQIHHIHFEGQHYWIYLGSSGLREFFKRIA